MFNITDILSLGTEYTVINQDGVVIKTVQVIPHTEILEAANGQYSIAHGTYTEYLNKSISLFTGFDEVDINRVLWHSTLDEEIILSDIIEYAVKNGYDKIILEHLDEIEDCE